MDIFDDIQQGSAELSEVGVHAGFPNPAAERDPQKPTLSLDRLLVARPNSTYFFRVQGHRWSDQGIGDGDIAVVDRAPRPTAQDLVVVWQDDFVLCRYNRLPVNAVPWGVITAVIHRYRSAS